MRRKILAALATVTVVLTGVVAAPAGAADVAPLEVVVTNRGGGPLKGAEVTVTRGRDVVATEVADAHGSVKVPLAAGDYTVRATFDSVCVTASPAAASVQHVAGVASRAALTIDGVSVITGRLTADGAPAVGALVNASGAGKYRNLGAVDSDGRFAFEACPGVPYQVWGERSATSAGYFTTYLGGVTREADAATVSVPAGSAASVDIPMFTQVGSISVKVVDAKGKPQPDTRITVHGVDRNFYLRKRTDRNGNVRLDGMLRGTYTVGRDKTVTVTPKKTSNVTINVDEKWGTVKVTVKAPAKLSKKVSLDATVKDSKGVTVGTYHPSKRGTTNISDLPAGKYRVILGGTNISKKITVKRGKTTRVSFTRPLGTTITGTVRKANGKPFKGKVHVSDGHGTYLGAVTTTSKGRYTLKGAVKGRYVVSATGKDRTGKTRAVTVKKGKTAKVNLRFAKTVTLAGKVVTDTGRPAAEVGVTLVDSWGQWSWNVATTDVNGRYEIKVVPGKYTIHLKDASEQWAWDDEWLGGGYFHATSKSPVTVKAGKTTAAPTITVRTR